MPFDSDDQRRAFFGKLASGTLGAIKAKARKGRSSSEETTEQRIQRLTTLAERQIAEGQAQFRSVAKEIGASRPEPVEDEIERRALQAYAQKQLKNRSRVGVRVVGQSSTGLSKRALKAIKSAESWMRPK